MDSPGSRSSLVSWLARFQGAYYLATGVWPLIHMGSFLAVTGPKTDLWLVRTVGVLVAVIGASLLMASRQPRLAPESLALAAGSALGLAAIEIWHVTRGVIAPIYLADAALEIPLAAALLLTWRRPRPGSGVTPPGR